MAKDSTPYQQTQGAAPSNDPAALLLDILRRIDKEVAVPALPKEAQDVLNYYTQLTAQLTPDSSQLVIGLKQIFEDMGEPDMTQHQPGSAAR